MKLSANIRKWICQLTVIWFWQNRLDFLCARSHTPTHTRLTACPGLPGWAGTRKVKTNLDFTEARDMGGSDISWAVCKSAPRCRQITMPAPHHSVFTGRMPFLPPNQQRQSTEGKIFCAQWPNYSRRTTWRFSRTRETVNLLLARDGWDNVKPQLNRSLSIEDEQLHPWQLHGAGSLGWHFQC